jgi:RNA polymerase-binding transcription factor DksA
VVSETTNPEGKKMNTTELQRIESRLLEERERANAALQRADEAAQIGTDEDGDLTRYPMHPADQGTDTQGQEQALSLLSQETERLTLIDDALLRLARDPESFGTCENCNQPIAADRLELVPWTRFCMDCQTRKEGAVSA